MKVVPLILYPWLAISVVIYIRRLSRRSERKKEAAGDPAVAAAEQALRTGTTPPPMVGPRPSPPAGGKAAGPVLGKGPAGAAPHVPHVPHVPAPASPPPVPHVPAPSPGAPIDASVLPLEPAVAAALEAEGKLAPAGGSSIDADAAAAAGRSGLFAGEDRPVARPLSEMISGIALPCDLMPLVSLDQAEVVGLHATFATSGHPASTVGRSLGDELERLGFTLRSTAENEVVARRGRDQIRVTIHARPDLLERDEVKVFPTTEEGDVVVEFRVDAGS
jgi:hypothetical protein